MTEPADVRDVPPEVLAKIRSACVALPQAYEEPAWVGTRWRIRGRTFAHVLRIDRAGVRPTPGPPALMVRSP